jgi:two-component system LytT family sensor kinase
MNTLLAMVNPEISVSKGKLSNAGRISLHVFFWIFFTVIFFISPPKKLDAAMVLSWLSILSIVIAVVYINLYVLLPQLFFQKKYILFFSILPVLIIVGAMLISSLSYLGYMAINIKFFDNLKNLFFFVIISSTFRFFRENERKKNILQEYEKNQLEMELTLLKSQVNPHFLFNTLNNLYATNLSQPAKANEMIMQLSEILRFQIDVSRKNLIPLTDEIQLIENYINLERVRLYESHAELKKKGDFSGYSFPPLLLLPLVENAFKYGRKSFTFNILIENDVFTFEAINEMQQTKGRQKNNGIGIPNVKKRLELIFPNRHLFETSINENCFYVLLKIDL